METKHNLIIKTINIISNSSNMNLFSLHRLQFNLPICYGLIFNSCRFYFVDDNSVITIFIKT